MYHVHMITPNHTNITFQTPWSFCTMVIICSNYTATTPILSSLIGVIIATRRMLCGCWQYVMTQKAMYKVTATLLFRIIYLCLFCVSIYDFIAQGNLFISQQLSTGILISRFLRRQETQLYHLRDIQTHPCGPAKPRCGIKQCLNAYSRIKVVERCERGNLHPGLEGLLKQR